MKTTNDPVFNRTLKTVKADPQDRQFSRGYTPTEYIPPAVKAGGIQNRLESWTAGRVP